MTGVLRRARITGARDVQPLSPLDPRDHAWRSDIADLALADRIVVPTYVAPVVVQAAVQAPLLRAPQAEAQAVSEILPGEDFALIDESHGFAWGYCVADGYVGYVRRDALVEGADAARSTIGPADALLFAAPDIKAPVRATLPAGARICTQKQGDDFHEVIAGEHAGSFVHRRHVLDDSASADWVDIARLFLGTAYRWGGRSRQGIDCSGLVQLARQLAGHRCRRDSDMICADAGEDVAAENLRRGDLACWSGHIAILLDAQTILHANAHWMRCVEEPLADVLARQAAAGQPAPRWRRFRPR